MAHGTFETSHIADCPDVAPECETMEIEPHEHRVKLGLTHYELQADYGLRENLQLSLRLPYDLKAMRVRYTTLDGAPFTPPYGDIHHRSETLTGISDPSLVAQWSPHPDWIAGLGTTLPVGRIERDPVELGRRGQEHQHIQFGSGTFQPKLSLQWMRRATPVSLFASVDARLSLYENREGFRAPASIIWSTGPSFRAGRVSIDTRLTGQYQTIGRWSGEIDEGSGFENGGVRLGLSLPWRGTVLAPSVYRELFSRGFHAEYDETFNQGTTFSLALSRTF